MNIALLGYGKMGKTIEQVALKRNHAIVARIDVDSPEADFSRVDAGIDFSSPEAALDNIKRCLENGVPVVSGTTGWLERYEEAASLCREYNGAFLYASNFSLGVNLFFELNRQLAKLMQKQRQYSASLEEIHHTQKLDAPSGTAITLAEDLIAHSAYTSWSLEQNSENQLHISSIRQGDEPGTHSVRYESSVDGLEITHRAYNREGFALGAVVAAEWIIGKTGVFSMKDVLFPSGH